VNLAKLRESSKDSQSDIVFSRVSDPPEEKQVFLGGKTTTNDRYG
jgi:hypothetical protein